MPSDQSIHKAHYTSLFLKSFQKLPEKINLLYADKERLFFTDPYHPQLKTHKLSGKLSSFWAFSVDYHYRVLFRFITPNVVIFYDIGTHEIYRQI